MPRPDTSRSLDQFYTRPEVAQACLDYLHSVADVSGVDLWIEPSAGAGAFLTRLPENRIGIDIAPPAGCCDVEVCDFLAWHPDRSGRFAVVGNPPFGKNASLAVRFFNHAAAFADIVALIVPRTFEKASVQNRLDPWFHLEGESLLIPESFTFRGEVYSVPSVFQVWTRKSTRREPVVFPVEHRDFEFVDRDTADFSFQRVGVNAGTVRVDDFHSRSPSSHYFIRDDSAGNRVADILFTIDWRPVRERTAGCPSISKRELVREYVKAAA